MFYDKFSELCKQRGVAPSFVVQEIGLSKPNATFWKNGSIPKGSTLKKLADYFGVPVDCFFSEAEKQEIDNIIGSVSGSVVPAETIRERVVENVLENMEFAELDRVEELLDKQTVECFRSISDEELEKQTEDFYRHLNRLGRISIYLRLEEMMESTRYTKRSE